ncbi:MAG: hypothetical protein IIA82_00960 [Thaumarchaeota archaeon]|nr:hypothetical protein [Nitrososphaerota archaeon]
MSSNIARMLRQLSKDELLVLAKQKKARIKPNVSKPKLAELLEPYVTQSEIQRLFNGGSTGIRAVIAGAAFEKKSMVYFTRRGFDCKLNYVKIKGMEFDIVGEKTTGTVFKKTHYIIAECKNKPKVIMQDFDKFLGKYIHFVRKYKLDEDRCQGFMITSGIFDPMVKSAVRTHPEITLHRIIN